MIFESKKVLPRVNDAIILSGVLMNIEFILYDKMTTFLAFSDKEEVVNLLIQLCLVEIDEKIKQDALKIYLNNSNFFVSKYLIDVESFKKLTNNNDKANYIISQIIKYLYSTKFSLLYLPFSKNSLDKTPEITSFMDTITIDCPILLEKFISIPQNLSITSPDLLYSPSANNKIFYLEENFLKQNPIILEDGLHFEKYVIFNFSYKDLISAIDSKYKDDKSFKIILDSFINNLNLYFFDKKEETEIIVNPELFKKIFKLYELNKSTSFDTQITANLPKFISNFKVGYRLILRDCSNYASVSPELAKVKSETNQKTKQKIKQKLDTFFSKKDKLTKGHTHILICSEQTKKSFNFANYTIQKLHDFIDEPNNIYELQNKIKENNKFKTIFENLIPLSAISSIQQTYLCSLTQKSIEDLLSGKAEPTSDDIKNNLSVAKIVKPNIENLLKQIVIK